VDAAEGFKNHEAGIFDKLVEASDEEEVIVQHFLALVELLPSTIKVKIDVEMLQELCDWIFVCVRLLENRI
jgi:hypothetical protein